MVKHIAPTIIEHAHIAPTGEELDYFRATGKDLAELAEEGDTLASAEIIRRKANRTAKAAATIRPAKVAA